MTKPQPPIDWYEASFGAIFGACIGTGGGILYHMRFDPNAILTLLGAFIGVAAVVLVTQGQQERQRLKAKWREAEQIGVFLDVLKEQIRSQAQPLFVQPVDDAHAYTACLWTAMTVDQVHDYVDQVSRFALHLDFEKRAFVSRLIADCGPTADTLRAQMMAADAYPPTPDWQAARRSAVNIQNAIELAKP